MVYLVLGSYFKSDSEIRVCLGLGDQVDEGLVMLGEIVDGIEVVFFGEEKIQIIIDLMFFIG